MKTSSTKKQITLTVACALAMGLVSSAAIAQSHNFGPPEQREVWTEGTKTQIWRNAYGECWHSAFGPPPGYNECNPAPVAQYVPPPAPVVVPPPPPKAVEPPPPAPVIAPEPPKKVRG
jgi:hypothetical protein